MTNPRPRPALRKAADAEIHPAAPRPARSPRARTAVPAPAPVPDARPTPDSETVTAPRPETAAAPLKPAKKRHADPVRPDKPTKRKFSGATSDHLRVPEMPEVTASQRAALDHLFDGDPAPTTRRDKDKGKAKNARAAKVPKPVDLMSGKPVDLGASVPKALRSATREEAKKRGLDVDAVVTDLLHAWLTDRG